MAPAVVGLKDQRIDFRHEVVQAVEIGPSNSAYQSFPANNEQSTSSAIFSIKPPGVNSGLGRYIRLHVAGSAVFTFAAAPTATELISFRQWPLNSIIATTTANINNSSITLSNVADIVPVVNRVANSFKNMNTYQSGTATAPDALTRYNDAADTLMSPFAAATSVPLGDVNQSRVVSIINKVYNAGARTITITFDIIEPILNPLFQADTENVVSLVGVNQLNLNIVYTNIWRMFSVNVGAVGRALTDVAVAFTTQEIYVNFVTSPDMLFKQIPAYYSVPNIRLDQAATTTAIAFGAETTGNSSTIQLDKVPRYLVVWVTPSSKMTQAPVGGTAATDFTAFGTGACGATDLLLPITNVSINCYNQTGLMSSASQHQLYTMSCAAGLTNTTFSQFRSEPIITASNAASLNEQTTPRFNAAPVIIPFSNLSLPLGLAPDSDQGTTLSLRVKFVYQGGARAGDTGNPAPLPGYVINVMTIVDGILELDNGSSVYMYGGLSREQVMNATEASRDQVLTIDAIRSQSMIMGAGFWDKLKSGFNWVKEHVAPIAKDIYQVARPLVHEGLQALGPEGAIASQALTKIGGARARLQRHHPKY